jgi:hypothetical protein
MESLTADMDSATAQVSKKKMLDSYQHLFCRRCFMYDCRYHQFHPLPRLATQPAPIKRAEPCGAQCYKSGTDRQFTHIKPSDSVKYTPFCRQKHKMKLVKGTIFKPYRCINCSRHIAIQCFACLSCAEAVCKDCLAMDPNVVSVISARSNLMVLAPPSCFLTQEADLDSAILPPLLRADKYMLLCVCSGLLLHQAIRNGSGGKD